MTDVVDKVLADGSEENIENVITELTGSGAAGSYEVPLGAKPAGRRKRKQPKTPKTIEYK